jgi:Uma2 family endonuclease
MNRQSQLVITEGAAPARFTAAEFLHMAELGAFDGMKVELDHGEIIRMTPPHTPHGLGQGRVIGRLAAVLEGSEVALTGEVTILLGEDTVRALDAAVIAKTALDEEVLRPEHVLLGVEVSDTTLEQDLGRKLRDYAAAGIPVYWVVDVNARVVHVMSDPVEGGYSRREVVRFGEPLSVPGAGAEIILD